MSGVLQAPPKQRQAAAAKAQAEALATNALQPAPSDKQRIQTNAVRLGVNELAAKGSTFGSVHAEISLTFSPLHISHSPFSL